MLRLTPFNGDQAVTSTTYDRAADTFYVRFTPNEIPVAETREVGANVLLDLNAEGAVIGGKVLSARALLGSELDAPLKNEPQLNGKVWVTRFDTSEYLKDHPRSQEEIFADALKSGHAGYIADVLAAIARARSRAEKEPANSQEA
jgi:uncharacterized protein YuzE